MRPSTIYRILACHNVGYVLFQFLELGVLGIVISLEAQYCFPTNSLAQGCKWMCRMLLLAWPCWNRVAFTQWKPPPCREKTLNCCISFCRILISHEGPVWAIERKGDFLVSGSSDKTVSECIVVVICLIAINCQCSVNLNKSFFS